jgi:hypothetical protein
MEDLPVRRILVSHCEKRAIADPTEKILSRVGYSILPAADWALMHDASPSRVGKPDLRLVDDRCWDDVPPISEAPEPIIMLTSRVGSEIKDRRISGAIMRPAGLHDLFRLLQTVLEERPRSTPRVSTELKARYERDGKESQAAILSLSDNGCLLRGSEMLSLGTRLRLVISIPGAGEIETDADVAYHMLPDVGLVFNATLSTDRQAIHDYVCEVLSNAAESVPLSEN